MTDFKERYLSVTKARFQHYKDIGTKALSQVDENDINRAFNADSNSIAIIVKHLSGNMVSRWTHFLTTDGEKPWRNRDGEFEGVFSSGKEMMGVWEKGWECCLKALGELTVSDLEKTVQIRSEDLTVVDAVERQLAHAAYHVGQIAYVAKMWKGDGWQTLSIPKKKS